MDFRGAQITVKAKNQVASALQLFDRFNPESPFLLAQREVKIGQIELKSVAQCHIFLQQNRTDFRPLNHFLSGPTVHAS